jgi:Flp pilus assembly pilin Flp
MGRVVEITARFWRHEGGATAIEYAMIAAGIGATIAATVWQFGGTLRDGVYAKVYNVM